MTSGSHNPSSGPTRRRRRRLGPVALLAVGGAAVVLGAGPALASTTSTTSASLTGGSLAVTGVASATSMSGALGGTISGALPAATLQDATGTGAGWHASVQVSDLNYTGAWTPVGSAPALTTTTSGVFTDAVDGVTYTVTTGAIAAGIGPFTYTSTDSGDPSGSGTAAASTAVAVGTKGVTINFGVLSVPSGSQYVIHVGNLGASAMSLNTAGGSVTTVSGNTAPTLTNNGATMTGGGATSSSYGTAVTYVSAAMGNGMGTYTAAPGVQIATDANSWAATYTAGMQYSITSGP